MEEQKLQKAYVLCALEKLGALAPAQISRYLFEHSICERFSLQEVLAKLKEKDYVKQAVSINGITYELTEAGMIMATQEVKKLGKEKLIEMECVGEILKRQFTVEEDFLARYTEQANGIVPIYLTLREGPKILMKIDVIVPDTEIAKTVTKNWAKNARETHQAVWDCIGEGLPFPQFDEIL